MVEAQALQGPFCQLCLPQLPPTFSTAAQIQQLVTLCVMPMVLAKHHIRGFKDLKRLPSPATTGRQLRGMRWPSAHLLTTGSHAEQGGMHCRHVRSVMAGLRQGEAAGCRWIKRMLLVFQVVSETQQHVTG